MQPEVFRNDEVFDELVYFLNSSRLPVVCEAGLLYVHFEVF